MTKGASSVCVVWFGCRRALIAILAGTLDSAEEAAALHFTVDHRLVQSDMIRLEVELDLLFCDFSCLHPTNQSSEMLGNLTILCTKYNPHLVEFFFR